MEESGSSSSGDSGSTGAPADPYGTCAACDGLCIAAAIAEVCAPWCSGDGGACPNYGSCEDVEPGAAETWVCMLLCATDPEAVRFNCPDGMACAGWNNQVDEDHVICWWYD